MRAFYLVIIICNKKLSFYGQVKYKSFSRYLVDFLWNKYSFIKLRVRFYSFLLEASLVLNNVSKLSVDRLDKERIY